MASKDSRPTLDGLVDLVERLPASAAVVRRLLELTRSGDVRVDDLVACLERDPALAARLLHVVNSSRYALRHRVGSLRHAAMLLGPPSLRLLAISFSILSAFTATTRRQQFRGFWGRSGCLATLAGEVSRLSAETEDEECYVAGLLVDTGVLVFATFADETYAQLHAAHDHGDALAEAEREAFGFDHTALGARLLERWELPKRITEAVRSHHRDQGLDEAESRCVRAAQLVLNAAQDPTAERVREMADALQNGFGIEAREIRRFLEHSRRAVESDAGSSGAAAKSLFTRETVTAIAELLPDDAVAVPTG